MRKVGRPAKANTEGPRLAGGRTAHRLEETKKRGQRRHPGDDQPSASDDSGSEEVAAHGKQPSQLENEAGEAKEAEQQHQKSIYNRTGYLHRLDDAFQVQTVHWCLFSCSLRASATC